SKVMLKGCCRDQAIGDVEWPPSNLTCRIEHTSMKPFIRETAVESRQMDQLPLLTVIGENGAITCLVSTNLGDPGAGSARGVCWACPAAWK
ncbi:MAG: hypothetical protein M3Y27_15395, partial [Acidobacteriota bacterium]|nr:hypothetical protein [Acidobacteriota bacterium]